MIHDLKNSINIILRTDKKSSDLASYHHASLFSPTHDTLIKACKNNFLTTFPGLNDKLISKHLPTSTNKILGHLRQERQGLRSTKNNNNIVDEPTTESLSEIISTDFFRHLIQIIKKHMMLYTLSFRLLIKHLWTSLGAFLIDQVEVMNMC